MNTESIKDKNQESEGFEPLLSEFTPPTYTQWKDVAVKSLKGKPFEKLIKNSYEEIEIQPIYNQADVEDLPHTANEQPGLYPYLRGCDPTGYKINAWDVSQEIPYETSEEFNKTTLRALERGQSAISIKIDPESPTLSTIKDFEIAFKNIDLEAAPLNISAGNAAVAVYTQLIAYYKQNDFSLEKLNGSTDIDPIGKLAVTGSLPCSLQDAYKRMSEAVKFAADNTPGFTTVEVNTGVYHEAGANAVQELAFAVATGAEYIKNLIENDVTADDAAEQIKFNFKVGPNFFMEIAKFRAAKMLWAKIVKEFGGSDEACIMNIYVKTSGTNMTALDPYVNMLRTTGESISAIIGGCDSLQVAPFDEGIRPSGELSRRLARNTQIILKEECNMTEVIDPAGGSYYVEHLTDQLMRKAWDLFAETEKLGGMTQALIGGFPQTEIKRIANERVKNFRMRKDVLVGTNKYPNFGEKPLEIPGCGCGCGCDTPESLRFLKEIRYLKNRDSSIINPILEKTPSFENAVTAAEAGATLGEIVDFLSFDSKGESADKLLDLNIPAMFETIRAKANKYEAEQGEKPMIFAATMGTVRQHKGRFDFAADFFKVGGFDISYAKGYDSTDEAVKSFAATSAKAVVVCSSDDNYPEIVPTLTAEVKKINPSVKVIVAGYPKEHIESFKEAGVDDFIHVRANIFDILTRLQKELD